MRASILASLFVLDVVDLCYGSSKPLNLHYCMHYPLVLTSCWYTGLYTMTKLMCNLADSLFQMQSHHLRFPSFFYGGLHCAVFSVWTGV